MEHDRDKAKEEVETTSKVDGKDEDSVKEEVETTIEDKGKEEIENNNDTNEKDEVNGEDEREIDPTTKLRLLELWDDIMEVNRKNGAKEIEKCDEFVRENPMRAMYFCRFGATGVRAVGVDCQICQSVYIYPGTAMWHCDTCINPKHNEKGFYDVCCQCFNPHDHSGHGLEFNYVLNLYNKYYYHDKLLD